MLNENEVKHVANLARLQINNDEIELYGKQLYDILTEIEKIINVDVKNESEILISPTTNTNCYKQDKIGHMNSKEEIFKNVKNVSGDYIVVPKVIND